MRPGDRSSSRMSEYEDDRECDARKEIRGRSASGLSAEIRVSEHEAQPFLELVPEARLLAVDGDDLGPWLLLADSEDEESRGQEADGVDEDGVRGREDLDEDAAEPWPADLRRRASDFELRVPLDDLRAVDEGGQVRLIGDVEEDLEGPDEEPDDEELAECQRIREVGDRNRHEECSTREVADDQDRTPRQTVDPHACRQREEDERQELDGRERSDLEGARVENQDRDERERELSDLRPELADRLRRPELQEVAMAPETAGGPEPTHRRLAEAEASALGRVRRRGRSSRLRDRPHAGDPR